MCNSKYIIYWLKLILLVLISSACEKSLDYQVNNQPAKPVLFSFPMPDSILKVHLSLTTDILDNNSFSYLNNAQLDAYINDTLIFTSPYPQNREWFTIPSIKGETASNYKLIVVTNDGDSLSSHTTIPKATPIVKLEQGNSKTVLQDDIYEVNYKFICHFSDPKYEQNYYQLRVDAFKNNIPSPSTYTINYIKDDPVFIYLENESDLLAGIDYQGSFNDALIDGMDYELKLSIPKSELTNEDGSINTELEFHLYSISKEYYSYLRSSIAEEANRNNIFYEPSNIYSNVDGGIGAVAGLSVSKMRIILNE